MSGKYGNDTLDGGTGNDTMFGGFGDDLYLVDSVHDLAIEYPGAGNDTVKSSANYRLGSYLENLTLTGRGNINGTGNDLSNRLIGNSGDNKLSGGSGAPIQPGKPVRMMIASFTISSPANSTTTQMVALWAVRFTLLV